MPLRPFAPVCDAPIVLFVVAQALQRAWRQHAMRPPAFLNRRFRLERREQSALNNPRSARLNR